MESQEVPYSFELHHKWTAIGVVAAEMAIGRLEDSTGEEQFGINIAQIFSARDIKHRLPLLVAMQDHSFLDSLESLKQLFEGITRQRMSGTVDEAALLKTLGATAEKHLAGESPFEDNADGAVQNMAWLAKITKKQAKLWRKEGIIKGSPKRGFKITEDGRSYLEWMREQSPSMNLTEEMFIRQCNKVLRPSIQRSDARRKKKATATNPQNVKDIQTFFESLAHTAGVETDVIERFAVACGFKVTDGVATSTKRLSAEFAPRTGEVLVQVRGLEDLLAFSQEGDVDTLNPDVLKHLSLIHI